MKLRLGIDPSIPADLLQGYPAEVELVRVPEVPEQEIHVDFWVPALPARIVKRQWPFLRGVRVVQALWAGVDTLLGIFPPDITFCDGRGIHDIPTAEWAIAAIMAMQKSLPFFLDQQRQGRWVLGQQASQVDASGATRIKNPPAPMREIAAATVLIVGYGAIGNAIESRLAGFGARFLRVGRSAREGVAAISALDGLLPQADIILLTLPLTSETHKMFDHRRLALMRPAALLVNASRGAIVDSSALLEALVTGKIRAALDVTDPEPLPAGHPLWTAPNLLITPHVAGDSERFLQRAFSLVHRQVERYLHNRPLENVVTGEY